MSDLTAHEIATFLQDEEFTNEVIAQALARPEVTEDLAEEIADELSDLMEDDPRIQRRLLTEALKGDGFKQQVIEKLIEELSD